MYFLLRVSKNSKTIKRCSTHSKRRFLKNLRMINWEKGDIEAYLKVEYGKSLNAQGKLTNFYNDGKYSNKEDLWLAFNAFIEE